MKQNVEKVIRYDPVCTNWDGYETYGTMSEELDGDYVSYEDYKELLDQFIKVTKNDH